MIDTHAHLDEAAFDVDRDQVIARAQAAGLTAIITIGTTAETSRAAVEIAGRCPGVFAAVGIQPNYVAEAKPGDWETIEQLALSPGIVAIGETGLDRYWNYAGFDQQVEYFDRHLDLAHRRNLPFVVHCREAEADVVARLQLAASRAPLRGVMHSFTGNRSVAEACLELGLYISFAGMATFKKSQTVRETAVAIPADRILIETDAPYLAPTPFRGKRNEPAYVVHTAKCLAELRGEPLEDFLRQTAANARALFGLPVESAMQ